MSLILISHDLGVIGSFCDNATVMHDGLIVEYGPVRQILYHASHPYTRKLLDAYPSVHDKRKEPAPAAFDKRKEPAPAPFDKRKDTPQVPQCRESVLEVHHLKKYYPTPDGMLHAVEDVSFSVPSGTVLGIIGESGCGKSTLGRCILRLTEATEGEILYRGKEISGLSAEDPVL